MVQLQIRGVDIDFPFQPYDCQVSYMEKVIHCLQEVSVLIRLITLLTGPGVMLKKGAKIWGND